MKSAAPMITQTQDVPRSTADTSPVNIQINGMMPRPEKEITMEMVSIGDLAVVDILFLREMRLGAIADGEPGH